MNTIDLINGVTLISSTQIDTFDISMAIIPLVFGFISLIVFGGCIYYSMIEHEIKFMIGFGTITFALTCIFFGFTAHEMSIKNSPDRYKDQYVVTIDENVSMKEFYDNYNIIKVEGEFYTIEEKK